MPHPAPTSKYTSLIGKIAAYHVQHVADPVAVSAVDGVESLTTRLSGRIRQKIMVLDRRADAATSSAGPEIS